MQTPLRINTVTLRPGDTGGRVIDLTGRCGFALCVRGDFVVRILNESYRVRVNDMVACMPFIKIEVTEVMTESEVIIGSISLKDVPRMINRWVNTENLSAIQRQPLISLHQTRASGLHTAIEDYLGDLPEQGIGERDAACNQIQQDIVDLQGRLLVAKVLKAFLTDISMEPHGYMPRDLVYQQFMLSLYVDFREHRDVKYYARRSGVSEKYFSTLVRFLSGASPSEWIETVVIGEAKTLLSDSQLSIKEVASSLNFPDAPTFTKYFRRVAGLTPKAYRRLL